MSKQPKVQTPFAQRIRRARTGLIPLAVWLGASYLALQLWLSGPSPAAYVGVVHSQEIPVTAQVGAPLLEVQVALYQWVQVGDPLAILDDAGLQADMETARAEQAQLTAEVAAQRANLEADAEALQWEATRRSDLALSTVSLEYPAELRAFHSDESRLEVALLETLLAITTSDLELDRLELRLKRTESMVRQSIRPSAEFEDLEKQFAQETERGIMLRAIEAGQRTELKQAQDRRHKLETGYQAPDVPARAHLEVEPRLAGLKAAILVQQRRLQALSIRRAAYVCRAPVSGRIASVFAAAGQFVAAGETLMVLSPSGAKDVALWLREGSPNLLDLGDRFLMAAMSEGPSVRTTPGVIHSVGPRFELMPEKLWRDPRIAEYGRPYLIRPEPGRDWVPGERVRLDRVEPGGAP